MVTPELVYPEELFGDGRKLKGPAVAISHILGEGSGGFIAADFIRMAFPAYQSLAYAAEDLIVSTQHRGPYATDILTRRSDSVVEYETPPSTKGMGTYNWLEPNETSIRGVAILVGATPDLFHVQIRLDSAALSAVVIEEVEREPLAGQ